VNASKIFIESKLRKNLPYSWPNADTRAHFRKLFGSFEDLDIDVGILG
jgi:hypothetical protein